MNRLQEIMDGLQEVAKKLTPKIAGGFFLLCLVVALAYKYA